MILSGREITKCPKPGKMEETLEGGRGPPRAVAPLEREREITKFIIRPSVMSHKNISVSGTNNIYCFKKFSHDIRRSSFHV